MQEAAALYGSWHNKSVFFAFILASFEQLSWHDSPAKEQCLIVCTRKDILCQVPGNTDFGCARREKAEFQWLTSMWCRISISFQGVDKIKWHLLCHSVAQDSIRWTGKRSGCHQRHLQLEYCQSSVICWDGIMQAQQEPQASPAWTLSCDFHLQSIGKSPLQNWNLTMNCCCHNALLVGG